MFRRTSVIPLQGQGQFDPVDEGPMILQHADNHLFKYTAFQPRRPTSSATPLSEPQISQAIM